MAQEVYYVTKGVFGTNSVLCYKEHICGTKGVFMAQGVYLQLEGCLYVTKGIVERLTQHYRMPNVSKFFFWA